MNVGDDLQMLAASDAYRDNLLDIASAVNALNVLADEMIKLRESIQVVRDVTGDPWRLSSYDLINPHLRALCDYMRALTEQSGREHSRMIDDAIDARLNAVLKGDQR